MKRFILVLLAILVISYGAASCSKTDKLTGPETTISQTTTDTTATFQKPGAEQFSTQAQRDWWRNLGQAGRNAAIVNQGLKYYGQTGYPNCKAWVYKVVYQASQGVVEVPQTLPGADGWYLAYSPYLVGMSGGISTIHTGSIIQMRWPTKTGFTPHTMIVHSVGSGGFWVLEANWIPGTVGMRWINTSDFLSKVIAYSTYTVIG